MIFTGQKIIVLISSNTKTGAKIRKGSLGYVSSFGTAKFNFKLNAVLIPAKIVFTRFGYEKKRRIESKIVYLLYPIGPCKSIKHVRKYLTSKVKIAQSMTSQLKQDLDKEGVKLNKLNILVVNKTNIETDILSSKNEFGAWFSSILQSGIFHKLYRINDNNEFKKAKSNLLANTHNELFNLKKCLQYNGEITRQAKCIYKNKEIQFNIIRQFKVLLHLDIRKSIDKIRQKLINQPLFHHIYPYEYLWTINMNNIILEKNIIEQPSYKNAKIHINNWISHFNTITNTQ